MRIAYLTRAKLKTLSHEMARTLTEAYGYKEPMPDFRYHDVHKLESALARPKMAAFGKMQYPRLVDKAAILFYSIIKYHAFHNGNKRMGVAALLVFLRLNGFDFKKDFTSILRFARRVAASNRKDEDKLTAALVKWISGNIYPLKVQGDGR